MIRQLEHNSLSFARTLPARFGPLSPRLGRRPGLELRHLVEPLLLQRKLSLELVVFRVLVVLNEDGERRARLHFLRLLLDPLDLLSLLRGCFLSVNCRGGRPSTWSCHLKNIQVDGGEWVYWLFFRLCLQCFCLSGEYLEFSAVLRVFDYLLRRVLLAFWLRRARLAPDFQRVCTAQLVELQKLCLRNLELFVVVGLALRRYLVLHARRRLVFQHLWRTPRTFQLNLHTSI